MSLYEGDKNVGNFAHGSLGLAIEHGKVMGSHMSLNVQC